VDDRPQGVLDGLREHPAPGFGPNFDLELEL
jgi:hypothetical protein